MTDGKRKLSENIKKMKFDSLLKEYNDFVQDQENSAMENSPSESSDSNDSDNSVNSSSSESESESDLDNDNDNYQNIFEGQDPEIKELQEWVVSLGHMSGIGHKHSDVLLKILRKRLLPSLPQSTKTLLKCDNV